MHLPTGGLLPQQTSCHSVLWHKSSYDNFHSIKDFLLPDRVHYEEKVLSISCNSCIPSVKFAQTINILLLISHCFMLFCMRKCLMIIHFLCYKCPNCVSHSEIIVAVSFGIQIRLIYKDQLSSRWYQSPLDPITQMQQ